MAYQNVGTPRFFIDLPNYLRSIGLDVEETVEGDGTKLREGIFGIDSPRQPSYRSEAEGASDIYFDAKTPILKYINPEKCYIMGLNIGADDNVIFEFKMGSFATFGTVGDWHLPTGEAIAVYIFSIT